MNNQSKLKKFKFTSIWALFGSYIILFIVFSIASPYFCRWRNIQNILVYSSTMGIIASAITFVIISGSLEISVGSTSALTGVLVATVLAKTDNVFLGVVTGLATGLVCGAINASLIAYCHINPFITTMATMNIFRGIAYILTNGYPVAIRNKAYLFIGQGRILGFPVIVILFLLVFSIMGYVLEHSKFGRNVYSIGGNSEASFLAGISVSKTRFQLYVLTAFCASISGIVLAAQTGTGSPTAAQDTSMDAISSVVLGGAALAGGKGKMIGTLLVVLVYSTLSNGMVLLNISSFYQMVFKGLILIMAVLIDVFKGSGGYK